MQRGTRGDTVNRTSTSRSLVAGTVSYTNTSTTEPPRAFADKLTDRSEWKTITDILKFFEDTYECAGVCDPALFPIT